MRGERFMDEEQDMRVKRSGRKGRQEGRLMRK